MITTIDGEWIIDIGAMTCRNTNTNIVVELQNKGKNYIDKIRDMPIELFAQWAKLKNGEQIL
jgi:hypothetical protein